MSDEDGDAGLFDDLDWADRGTLIDVSVNLVPLLILVGFSVLFVVVRPWNSRPAVYLMMHLLTLLPVLLLAIVTYVSAKFITRDATEDHARG